MNSFPRIYYASPLPSEEELAPVGAHVRWWESVCERAAGMGFDSVLSPLLWGARQHTANTAPEDGNGAAAFGPASASTTTTLAALGTVCKQHKLSFLIDLVLDGAGEGATFSRTNEAQFAAEGGPLIDQPGGMDADSRQSSLHRDEATPEFMSWWGKRLGEWSATGVAGFRCLRPAEWSSANWRSLIAQVHLHEPECSFLAWTPGLTPQQIAGLAESGFESTFLSAPWWDYRSSWLVEEHDRLRTVAPPIAPLERLDGPDVPASWKTLTEAEARRRLWTAAFTGDGVLVPMGYEKLVGVQAIIDANNWISRKHPSEHRLRLLSGPLAKVTALFRGGSTARLFLVNPDTRESAPVDWQALRSRLPHTYVVSDVVAQDLPEVLAPAAHCLVAAVPAAVVKVGSHSAGEQRKTITAALRAPRLAIENVGPAVEQGRFPVKRTVGEPVHVEADVLMDGHEQIGVDLLWRAVDEAKWHHVAMQQLSNDRWQASFLPDRLGPHYYGIRAWHDVWATYCERLQKKVKAGQDVSLDVEEGRILIGAALNRVKDDLPFTANTLMSALDAIGHPQSPVTRPRSRRGRISTSLLNEISSAITIPPADATQVQALLEGTLAVAMRSADDHPFETNSDIVYPLTVERREARYASWYELFPRSHSPVPGAHGTFADVVERLPAIRRMGFDVLYFPPIHPIGLRNRKGKNNTLNAGPEDPGSPYAIGSAEGGHDAVHPELGTLEDFRDLVRAARENDLEIAMDFAIQCSPDHPWLTERPEWFDWRADGSLRYAENPPKRYEDIVNPDFYSPSASAPQQAALWRALRDIVLFWADQGVQTFRVDNPHTKPLPFWQWLIAEVQGVHPYTVFLSEAFTRPKMMYRLAKIGFSQSYTYFTWRHGKQELTDYLNELNTPPVADFFRPHFFVNTPDINPYFLQTSGRPGFLIRAALAATTSGLWGMYNGFELCEARPVPGKEEYLDSEKYEIRSWDWNRPGNIVAEITRLNQIRRSNPALQSHLGIRFHTVDNEKILFFSKTTPERDNVVIVAVSLDPHAPQTGTLELPLWQWDVPESRPVVMQDLIEGGRFTLQGKYRHVSLTLERPFLLWSLIGPG